MKVLITGGTGFIGSRLAFASVARGHSVKLLGLVNSVTEQENKEMLEKQGIEVCPCNVCDREQVARVIRGCDVVFHLAAAQHEANVPDQHFWDVNVEGTGCVLEASIEAGVKRFVHGSTIGVYGSAMNGRIDENTPVKPDNIYGETKLKGERLVLSYADKIPVSVVRISETYGPGDRRLLKLFKAIAKNVFFVIGRGANKHQLIYVEDLIEGLYLAATDEKTVGETFVLAGKEVLTTREMVDFIANGVGARVARLHAPLWPFMVAAVLMERTLRPLGIQPPLHRRRMDFFKKSFYFSEGKLVKKLGFQSRTSFAQGVSETAKWYKGQGYL